MVHFSLTESQKLLRAKAAKVAREVLGSAYPVYSKFPDQIDRFRATRPFYAQLVRQGLLKALIPKSDGGDAESLLESAFILEELYAVDSSITIHLVGTALGLLPLLIGGTPEQKQRFLTPFVSAEGDHLASLTHSEPGGTANHLEKGGKGLGVTAGKEGDYYVVNGEKRWTTNSAGWDAKGATLSCLCARYSEDGGPEKADVDPATTLMVLLTNFRVPVDHVLFAPGSGAKQIEEAFGITGAMVGAMAVGTMRAAFEKALAFAKNDHRGGSVPIIQRHSPADLLINAKMRIDSSRALVWKALDSLDSGPGDAKARFEACLEAKIHSSDSAIQCVYECMQVVGMTSYANDTGFPRLLADAAVFPLFDGGNIGIRRRQFQRLMCEDSYQPWANLYE
ncbi:acyl dehydrogenase [Fusarium pseudocircinatum]|uniref:Acyl dehydrogenase n=1 Tax=Fusarium pseudocircinatum TaxID=56676 RepID=A0A8H5NSM4_9HYPO|nr:acyl dehydrogenase [Fusarium pseudocircinatum]